MAIFIPDQPPLRSYAAAATPQGTLQGRVLVTSEPGDALPATLADLPAIAQDLPGTQSIWVPYTVTGLIRAKLEGLRPWCLCADHVPLPLDTWLSDHNLEWSGQASDTDLQRLHGALSHIASALTLRPGTSLRQRITALVPVSALALPVRKDIGPLPEPVKAAAQISARAFAPFHITQLLTQPVPIGPWKASVATQAAPPAGVARLTQVMTVDWTRQVPNSVSARYRPGRWYADPELQALCRSAAISTGGAYESPAVSISWASLLPAAATLAGWNWSGVDLLDPAAAVIAMAFWAALTADPHGATAEWWRSYDRAARLRLCVDTDGILEPVTPARLAMTAGDDASLLAALAAGWAPPSSSLDTLPTHQMLRWAEIIARHPTSGMPQLAAAHHLTVSTMGHGTPGSNHALAGAALH